MLSRMVRKGDCVTWPRFSRYADGAEYKGDGIVYRVTRVDGNLAHIETLDGSSSTLFIARFKDGLNQLAEIVEAT